MDKKYFRILEWLYSQLPSYQKIGQKALNNKLDNIISICNHLGDPQKELKTIHVAGTNGKGSTSHMLASILQESGYKVGLYTSPHLKDFRERIKINGREISKEEVIDFVEENEFFFQKNSSSFFEMTVGLAFFYFKKKNVDIAVVETGLGGRLDATNIIVPELSIITNVSFDHTFFLGHTLEKIATEKAGIIKAGIPVVVGENNSKTRDIFTKIADKNTSPIYFATEENFETDLQGEYQKKNVSTVVKAVEILNQKKWKISDRDIEIGLKNVVKNTELKGRWQIIQYNPKVVFDVAHNVAGILEISKQIKKEKYKNIHIVYGTSKDKNISEIVSLLPREGIYYLCKADIDRAMSVEDMVDEFEKYNYTFQKYCSVKSAYRDACRRAQSEDLILVTGSNFIVSEVV